jgi:hypothetical protein
MSLTAEQKKARNARYQAEFRAKQRLKRESSRIEKRVRETAFTLAPHREYLRAGHISGLLESSFSHNLELAGAESARRWLHEHPIGASYVLELLSVAGFRSTFLRWRGSR